MNNNNIQSFGEYKNETFTIDALINKATNKQAVIPSIQRPFVWKPNQIARFADSLMHGWPCGSLLFWDSMGEQEVFEARNFVLHGKSEDASYLEKCKTVSENAEPCKDYQYMVLDGQQRLQSLILIFSKYSDGITCTDIEWQKDLERSGGKRKESSTKFLCFNLSILNGDELSNLSESFHYLDNEQEDAAGLIWKTKDEIEHSGGKYIALKDVLHEKYYGKYTKAFNWLKEKIEHLMNLSITALVVSGSAKNDEDAESIVTMFTRLNTAGTPLTKEQILSAQIKKAWPYFPEKLSNMQEELKRSSFKVALDDDEIVRGFNILAMAHTDKEKLKDAYKTLDENKEWEAVWTSFEHNATLVLEALYERFLRKDKEYRAMYPIWYAATLLHLQGGKIVVDEQLGRALVKWVLLTRWAKIWANKSGQSVKTYNKALRNFKNNGDSALDELYNWLNSANIIRPASEYIENLQASARGSVRDYYTPLWIWMRLNEARSYLLSAFANNPNEWDVDHLIPAKWSNEHQKELHNNTHILNNLGNCWLLSHKENIKKKEKSFLDFLKTHDKGYNDLLSIQEIIGCDSNHLDITDKDDLSSIIEGIPNREKRIKKDLLNYINSADTTELYFFGPDDQDVQLNEGVYRGREFANSEQMKKLQSKSRHDYRRGVQTIITKNNLHRDKIKELLKHPNAYDELEPYCNDCNDTFKQGWRNYLKFLLGKNQVSHHTPNSARSALSSGECFMLEEFKEHIYTQSLAQKADEDKARKDKSNHHSYVTKYYKEYPEDITYKNIQRYCDDKDRMSLTGLKLNYKITNSGYHKGWCAYIDYLIEQYCDL